MQVNEVAQRISDSITIREKAEGKDITRFQLSQKSISAIAKREILTGHFMGELSSEMLNYGWCCFQVTSTSFAFLKLSTAQNFRRFNSDTLLEYLGEANDDEDESED